MKISLKMPKLKKKKSDQARKKKEVKILKSGDTLKVINTEVEDEIDKMIAKLDADWFEGEGKTEVRPDVIFKPIDECNPDNDVLPILEDSESDDEVILTPNTDSDTDDEEVHLLDEELLEASDSLLAFGDHNTNNDEEWVKVTGVMDSGAAKHVTNRETVPRAPIVPSQGSLRGHKFI